MYSTEFCLIKQGIAVNINIFHLGKHVQQLGNRYIFEYRDFPKRGGGGGHVMYDSGFHTKTYQSFCCEHKHSHISKFARFSEA